MTDSNNKEKQLKYQQWTSKYKTKKNNNEKTDSLPKRDPNSQNPGYDSDKGGNGIGSWPDCTGDNTGDNGEYPKNLSKQFRRRILMKLTRVKGNTSSESVNEQKLETKGTFSEQKLEAKGAAESVNKSILETLLTDNESEEPGVDEQKKIRNNDYVCVYSASESDNDDCGRQKLNLLIKKYKTSGHGNLDIRKFKDVGISNRLEREYRERTSDGEGEAKLKVGQDEKLWNRFKKVKPNYLKATQRCQKTKDFVQRSKLQLCESDPEISEEDSVMCNANAGVQKKKARNIQCELCQEMFYSDGKLDDHYMTHFKTIKGLNTFLNKKRKRKVSLSSTQRNSHSILKHSKKKKSGVKKKVMFEMDVDEGVDCRSPEINGSEISDFLFEKEDGNETVGKGQLVKMDTQQRKPNIKNKRKNQKKNEIGLKLKVGTVKSASVNMNRNMSVSDTRPEKLTFEVDGKRMYCDHKIDIARSCLLKDVKIMLNHFTLNLVNDSLHGNDKCKTKKREKATNIANWSVLQNQHKKQTGIESTNVLGVNEDQKESSLKLKFRKENKYELSVKKNRTNQKHVQSMVSSMKLNSEVGKLPETIKDTAGNFTSATIPARSVPSLLEQGPNKSSKSLQKVHSRSDENTKPQKCVLNLDNIKKDLLGWTKEFERMKSITENIAANSRLLDTNREDDTGIEIKFKDTVENKRGRSTENITTDKTERKKGVTAVKEHSIEEENIPLSSKYPAVYCERNFDGADEEQKGNFIQDNVSEECKINKLTDFLQSKTEKYILQSRTYLKSPQIFENTVKNSCKKENDVAKSRCRRIRRKVEDKKSSIERKMSNQNEHNIDDYIESRGNKSKIKLVKTRKKHKALSKEFISSSDCTDHDDDNEVIEGTDSENVNSDQANDMSRRGIISSRTKEKRKDDRQHEVQGNLEKMKLCVISKERIDIDKPTQCIPGDESYASATNINEHKLVHQELQAKQQLGEFNTNKTVDVLKDESHVYDSVLNGGSLLLEPSEDDSHRLQDTCYDDILNEFAEEVGIVLNSPDDAALMFDENALYENLENLSLKDSLSCDDSASSVNEDDMEIAESVVSLGSQTSGDAFVISCESESTTNRTNNLDVIKKSAFKTDGSELSPEILSSEMQVNFVNGTAIDNELSQKELRNVGNENNDFETKNVKLDDQCGLDSLISLEKNSLIVSHTRNDEEGREAFVKQGCDDEKEHKSIFKQETQSEMFDINHERIIKHVAKEQAVGILDEKLDNENTCSKNFKMEQMAESMDSLNSHSSIQNCTNTALLHGIDEVKFGAEEVNKFYRCDGCKALFYGVKRNDLMKCLTCTEKESKKDNELDNCKGKETGSMRFENEEKYTDTISENDCQLSCNGVSCSVNTKDRDHSDVSHDIQTQNSDAIDTMKCPGETVSDKEKKVKLVLQKMKTSIVKSEDCDFIGSPARPCWIVKRNEMKVTPLKVTCNNIGNKVEKVKSYNVNKTFDINCENQSYQILEKSVSKDAESGTKGKELKKTEYDKDGPGFRSKINKTGESVEDRRKNDTKLKAETKQSKMNQLQNKAAYIDVPNEFEKALWNDHTVKRNERCKKKATTKIRTKQEDQTIEKIQAQNKMMLLQRKNAHKSTSQKSTVQHFQKSKTAQMIYNKHQRKSFDDELPDFSATKLDLGNLPPLSVSQKDKSLKKDTNKDSTILFYKKELSLSETSSSQSDSPLKSTATETGAGYNSKLAGDVIDGKRKIDENVHKETLTFPRSSKQLNISAVDTRSISTNLHTAIPEAGGIKCHKTNCNFGAKIEMSHNFRGENYREDLKDLKKELEMIVMKKDNMIVNELKKSFNPSLAFTSSWRKENSGNNSISVLPSFSETFSKKTHIPASMNQTFNGFTIYERNSGSNTTEISTRTDSRYSDHDSAFTELSEQGADIDSPSESPHLSVFCRLGKRKSSEDSTSTIFPLQEEVTVPTDDGDISPLYSPEVLKSTSEKHQEENRNDFSSTPALKLTNWKSMFDDTEGHALDISLISQCSSTGIQEEVKAHEVSQLQSLTAVSDIAAVELKPKRRKIKRLEIPEPVSMANCAQANKDNCYDTQLSSMMIISADCSQIDLSNLEKTTFRKAMPEGKLKENYTVVNEDCGISVESVSEKMTESLDLVGEIVETNKDDLTFEATDNIEPCSVVEDMTDLNNNGTGALDNKTKSNTSIYVEHKENNNINSAMNNNLEHALNNNYKNVKEYNAESAIENNAESALENDAECAIENNAKYAIENNAESAIENNAESAIENIAESVIENNAESAIENNIESAIENNKESAIENNKESAKINQNESTEHYEESDEDNSNENVEESDLDSHAEAEGDNNDNEISMKTEDDSDSEEAADIQENDMCLQEGLDDILQLYASDEDASFLLDNEQPPPVASKLIRNNNSDKVAKFDEVIGDSRDINGNKPKVNHGESHCRDINANKTKFVKESCDVIDMDLDTDCILSASPKTKKNFPEKNDKKTPSPPVLLKGQFGLPLTANMIDENCYQQQKQEEVPVFQPMKSNPLKFRWMPSGWCFRHFNRKPCSVQCSFRHDVPSPDVLNRCMPDIIKQCRKGELNGAMNMLESQSYFQKNISEDDLDCLYGYSVNHLKMEYCHSLLQLIATRKLVKQGHIDDIILLWKRMMYSEDVKTLNDAFYIAKENKLFPNPRAVLILLEAFSATYGDVYILWDVITYCSMNKDYIIPEQFINKAVLMLVKCRDTYVLSAAVNWLQKTSPEQQSNISEETLSTFANSLQKRYMLKLAGSVRQCIGHKKCNNDKEEQQNLPRSNLKSNITNANVALPEDNKRTSNVQSRPVTRSYFELMNQTTGNQQTGIQQENLNQNHAGAVTQVGHDSANCSRLKPKQLLTSRLKSRSNQQPERDFVNVDSEGQRTVTLSNTTRAVTPTNVNNLGPLESGEQSGTEQDILNDIKHAFDISDWQGLADIFLLCCKNGRISPEVLEQVQLALTTHHTNIGDVWAKFIDHIKQKQRSDPGLRLDNYNLSVLGSEIFYSCYMMDLFDTKDVLLVILNTAFLSLSQFVSHKWNVCLELEAGEYLSKVGMPGKAAEIVLAFPSTSLEFLGAKDRLNTLVQLLIEQLCMEENFSLAFQLFCLAFSWKERGLRTIASDFIKSCLQAEFVVIPVQIYELYIADNAEFDIRETVKRSLLNALVENKNELRKNLYRDMKQSSVLFPEPSYEKPRCICIQSIHTCNEVKAIIECYLIDLYDLFCDLFVMNSRLSSEELSLDVTVIKMASQVHPVGLPYVGQVQMSPLLVKVILLTVFGIHSDLRNNNGNAKVSLHPDSLEKYMKNLDVNSKNIGLEFTAYSQCQNGKRLKVKR